LHAHNDERDSQAEFEAVLGHACGSYYPHWGEQTDVPNYIPAQDACYGSATGRPLSTFSCDRSISGRNRMCYCERAVTCDVTNGGVSSSYPCICGAISGPTCGSGQHCHRESVSGNGGAKCVDAPGWRLGVVGDSCAATCGQSQVAGRKAWTWGTGPQSPVINDIYELECSEQGLEDHNEEVEEALLVLPKDVLCTQVHTAWDVQPDVPNIASSGRVSGECYASKSGRAKESYSCKASVVGRSRFCYCSSRDFMDTPTRLLRQKKSIAGSSGKMALHPEKHGSKCDPSSRAFFHYKDTDESTMLRQCMAKCKADDSCAFLSVARVWCMGCKVPPSMPGYSTVAYRKVRDQKLKSKVTRKSTRGKSETYLRKDMLKIGTKKQKLKLTDMLRKLRKLAGRTSAEDSTVRLLITSGKVVELAKYFSPTATHEQTWSCKGETDNNNPFYALQLEGVRDFAGQCSHIAPRFSTDAEREDAFTCSLENYGVGSFMTKVLPNKHWKIRGGWRMQLEVGTLHRSKLDDQLLSLLPQSYKDILPASFPDLSPMHTDKASFFSSGSYIESWASRAAANLRGQFLQCASHHKDQKSTIASDCLQLLSSQRESFCQSYAKEPPQAHFEASVGASAAREGSSSAEDLIPGLKQVFHGRPTVEAAAGVSSLLSGKRLVQKGVNSLGSIASRVKQQKALHAKAMEELDKIAEMNSKDQTQGEAVLAQLEADAKKPNQNEALSADEARASRDLASGEKNVKVAAFEKQDAASQK